MDRKKTDYYKIIIASYLHDIGKILWRGGFERIIFKDDRDYNVAHAQHLRDIFLYPKEYFELNKKTGFKYNNELEDFKNIEFWKDIVYFGSLHHKKDMNDKYNKVFDYLDDTKEKEFRKKLVSILYLSDNIASLDRFMQENDIDEKLEKEDNKTIKEMGLGSIFENIFNFSDELNKNNFIFEPNVLDKVSNSKENQKINFKDLATKFLDDFLLLLSTNKDLNLKNEKELKKFVYDLDMIFQKYTSLVPSDSFQGVTQDLSLYDHTKIVVAISSVLYKKFINAEKTNLSYKTKDIQQKEISLIAGDFPSIQRYIFDTIKKQKSISKRLRAKSFTIQILNEAVIEFLLEKLGYSRSNILINAGGKFVIMTDKIDDNIIKELKENINAFFIDKYGGNIKFSLVSKVYKIGEVFASNTGEEFNLEKVKSTFIDLFDELIQDKFKVYSKNNLNNIFENNNISGKIMCKYCGNNYTEKIQEDENNDEIICDICENEKELGEKIVKNNHIYIDYITNNGDFEFKIGIRQGKMKLLFNNWNYFDLKGNIGIGKSINLGVPKDENGDTKDFETIINDDKKDGNIKGGLDYLCMLKGDIDAMSLIFKHGFDFGNIENNNKKTLYSVNRLTQFSRFLELFFGTYLNKKIEEKFNNVYTVFSGGDDFIFIVPFLQRQNFINFLYEEFYNFIGKNKKIHFSIGLGIFKPKTPFHTMDRITEELLKQAKLKSKQKNKNENDLEKKLKYRGLTIYEKDFTKVFENEKIDYNEGVKNWNKNSVNEDKKDPYNETLDINFIELSIGDTQIYSIYSELKNARELYKNQDYSDFVLTGSRILNMLARNNIDTRKNLGFINLKTDIENLIKKIEIGENMDTVKVEKINNMLMGIVDNIYKNRYKNK